MSGWISLAVGIGIGTISGLIGLGGAVFLIPILVYGYGMDQHRAQGTSVATLLLPIGALAFWKYYAAGNVDNFRRPILPLAEIYIGIMKWCIGRYI